MLMLMMMSLSKDIVSLYINKARKIYNLTEIKQQAKNTTKGSLLLHQPLVPAIRLDTCMMSAHVIN